MCAVKDIELDAVRDIIQPASLVHGNGPPTIEEPDTPSFLWNSITKSYSKRDACLNALNIYKYTANVFLKKQLFLNFGYNDHPSWALKQDYSK